MSGKGILLSGVVVRRAQSEQSASKGQKTENVERESRETVLVYFQGMCVLPFEGRIRSQFHAFHGILFTTSQPLTHATYTYTIQYRQRRLPPTPPPPLSLPPHLRPISIPLFSPLSPLFSQLFFLLFLPTLPPRAHNPRRSPPLLLDLHFPSLLRA